MRTHAGKSPGLGTMFLFYSSAYIILVNVSTTSSSTKILFVVLCPSLNILNRSLRELNPRDHHMSHLHMYGKYGIHVLFTK